jgi:hypothetical protein
MRCAYCGWGEIDTNNIDGDEMCSSCSQAMMIAQTAERDEEEGDE